MAKDSLITLCVSEYVEPGSPKIAWRPLAVFVEARKCFLQLPPNEPHVEFGNPAAFEVTVLDTAENRKLANGENDVRQMNTFPIYEVVECAEFKNVYVEDEDKIRNILRTGFYIPEPVKCSFVKGQTRLVVAIQSTNGMKRGLVFTDKSKLEMERDVTRGRVAQYRTKIAASPADKNRFLESVDIVTLESVPEIPYQFSAGSLKRVFLGSTPKKHSIFVPYSARDFAAIFFRRQLTLAKSNIQLSKDRNLTNADINAIVNSVEEILKNEDAFRSFMKIDSPEAAKEIVAGIQDIMPEIKNGMLQNSEMLKDIRVFLFCDEDIRQLCYDSAKEAWLLENDEERDERLKELTDLYKQISDADTVLKKKQKDATDMDTKMAKLNKEYETREASINKVSDKLQDAVAKYRKDITQLILDSGCIASGSYPMVIPGEAVTCAIGKDALTHNAQAFLAKSNANALATYIALALQKGLHLAVPGEYASLVANAVSCAMSGLNADTVICTDSTCSVQEMKRMTENAASPVVLIEGLLGCEPDSKTLALARHCNGKVLVFSIDDAYNKERISKTVFSRVALIDGLAIAPSSEEIAPMMDETPTEHGKYNAANAAWKEATSANKAANTFIKSQIAVMSRI